MKKSVIGIILLIVSLNLFHVFAVVPEDIYGTKYESAVKELTLLGVLNGYEDGTFRPENSLTRAEFSAVLVRALGVESVAPSMKAEQAFADVAPEHWAAGCINLASSLGIISGYGDGQFGPDDRVTGEQAVKMLICAIGYEEQAMGRGVYPQGFVNLAASLGVLRRVDCSLTDDLNRGYAAILTVNAMDVRLIDPDGKTTEETLKTQLYTIMGLVKKQGVVTGNQYTSLDSQQNKKEESIVIDGVRYHTGGKDYSDLLGYRVTYYVQNETASADNVETVYSIVKDNANQELVIGADRLIKIEGIKLEYEEEDGQTQTAELVGQPRILYNGKYITNMADWAIINGHLKLIDNDNDGVYDVISVQEYANYMVDSVSEAEGKIHLKQFSEKGESRFMGKTYIDTREQNVQAVISSADGDKITLGQLKNNQIISVYASKDGQLVNIVGAQETVRGAVTEVYSDGKAAIDGVRYQRAKNQKKEWIVDVNAGETGVFWLDVEGNITAKSTQDDDLLANVSTVDNEFICGYIVDGAMLPGLSGEVQLKILLNRKDGTREERIFDVADKVVLNGERMSNDECFEQLKAQGINRPVAYQLNSKGAVKELYPFKSVAPLDMRTYFSSNRSFDQLYFMEDDTLTYFVDVNNPGDVLEDAQLKLENNAKYYMQVFDPVHQEFSNRNRVYVIHTDLRYAGLSGAEAPMLINAISTYLDADGQTRTQLIGVLGDKTVTLTVDAALEEKCAKLSAGSLIELTQNKNQEISSFKLLHNIPPAQSQRGGVGGEKEYTYGRAMDIQSNANVSSCVLTVEYNKQDTMQQISYEVAGKPVYRYHTSSGRMDVGTLNDISIAAQSGSGTGSNVFVAVKNFEVQAIVVVL